MDRVENPFLYTLKLPVKTPASVVVTVVFTHIVSTILPCFSNLLVNEKLVVSFFVVISFCYYLQLYFFSSEKQQVAELILNAEDQWQVKLNNGVIYSAYTGATQFVHPWLTIISLKYNKTSQSFIFTPEVIDADQFRRLRVRLRYKIDLEN